MPLASPFENVHYRDGTRCASFIRGHWKRGGLYLRQAVKVLARICLSVGPPVLVPLIDPAPAGKLLLHGTGIGARHILLTGGFEMGETANFFALIKPGMTVFDLGGNLGVYTLLSAHAAGTAGSVHTFEPLPQLAGGIRQSLRLSGLTGKVNACAVSDRVGFTTLYTHDAAEQSGSHSLAPAPRRRGKLNVPVTTLDAYSDENGIGHVDMIKMDIEGAELLALKGAAGLLSGGKAPIIQAEMYDPHCERFGHRAADVCDFLQQFGYQAFRRRRMTWEAVPTDADFGVARNLLFLQERHWQLMPEHPMAARRASASSRA